MNSLTAICGVSVWLSAFSITYPEPVPGELVNPCGYHSPLHKFHIFHVLNGRFLFLRIPLFQSLPRQYMRGMRQFPSGEKSASPARLCMRGSIFSIALVVKQPLPRQYMRGSFFSAIVLNTRSHAFLMRVFFLGTLKLPSQRTVYEELFYRPLTNTISHAFFMRGFIWHLNFWPLSGQYMRGLNRVEGG